MSATRNRIRKNVALITRNLPIALNNDLSIVTPPAVLNNKIIYTNKTNTLKTLSYNNIHNSFESPNINSLIIIGGDLIIDADVIQTIGKTRGILVLQNEQ